MRSRAPRLAPRAPRLAPAPRASRPAPRASRLAPRSRAPLPRLAPRAPLPRLAPCAPAPCALRSRASRPEPCAPALLRSVECRGGYGICMFWKLLAVPRWIVAGSAALVVFVGYSIGFKLTKDLSWTRALVVGAGGAVTVFLATFVGLSLRQRELRAVGAGQLPPVRQAEAYRAAQRGHIHSDPEIRAVVLRIANHRLKGARRHRGFVLVAGALLAVSAALYLVDGRVVSATVSFVGVAAFGFLLWQMRTVQRRSAELVNATGELSPVGGFGPAWRRRRGEAYPGVTRRGCTGGDARGRAG